MCLAYFLGARTAVRILFLKLRILYATGKTFLYLYWTRCNDVKCIEEFVPELNVLQTQQARFEDALTNLNGKNGIHYNGFIAPPVEDCTLCGTALTAPNPLSSCTLYTVNGPKPCTKLTLRCQGCKVSYGRSMTESSSGNASYYPKEIISKDNLLEVTNVVYMEKKLYRWIPSLM